MKWNINIANAQSNIIVQFNDGDEEPNMGLLMEINHNYFRF